MIYIKLQHIIYIYYVMMQALIISIAWMQDCRDHSWRKTHVGVPTLAPKATQFLGFRVVLRSFASFVKNMLDFDKLSGFFKNNFEQLRWRTKNFNRFWTTLKNSVSLETSFKNWTKLLNNTQKQNFKKHFNRFWATKGSQRFARNILQKLNKTSKTTSTGFTRFCAFGVRFWILI